MLRHLSIVVLVTACSTEFRPEASVADSSGVSIVTSPGIDRPLMWRFEELHRFGGADDGPGSFASATRFNVGVVGGRIVVLDGQRSTMEIWNDRGEFVGSFGRAGSGPGELGEFAQLVDLGSGGFGAYDYNKQAVVAWSADGTILPERRVIRGVRAIHGDTVWASVTEYQADQVTNAAVLMVGEDSLPLDRLDGPNPGMTQFSCVGLILSPVFAPRFIWDFQDGMVASARQDRYEVNLHRGGTRVASIRRSVVPVETAPGMAAREYPDGWTVSFGGGGSCTVDADELVEKVGMAGTLPLIRNVALAPDGELWVERYRFSDETSQIDVFDREGRYLGTLEGHSLPLGWLGENRVLLPVVDEETGVTSVGVYRVDRDGQIGEQI